MEVSEALARIVGALSPVPAEQVGLAAAHGRVLAEPVAARLTKPALPLSAMDGYAVRAADLSSVPRVLRQVGMVPAGSVFEGAVGPGETVRIFTGAPLPPGTDSVLIQEDAVADGDRITAKASVKSGTYVRPAGLDFKAGEVKLPAGRRLGPREIALAAAMNASWLAVRRRPRVAILATGDEVVMPGEPVAPHQVVSSNALALAALVTEAGGEPISIGIARDTAESLRAAVARATGADLLLITGGASVGDHDLVRPVLAEDGLVLDFWQIAMRPGKPLMFGLRRGLPVIGLPGNPVSTIVCGLLFVRPAIEALLGLQRPALPPLTAILGCDLPANDNRQDYLRSRLSVGPAGELVVTPLDRQDSSMLGHLAAADALAVRPVKAPPARRGDAIEILLL